MKKLILSTALFLSIILLSGQVTFILNTIPDYTPEDEIIYIVGNLNGWDPGNPDYALEKNANYFWEIILPEEPEGTIIQFKFTRGDWGTVEKGASGEEIANRVFTYGNGDTVNVDILNWADNGGGGGTTATDNVYILDEEFYMPQLDRTRRIWIYLPPDYDNTNTSYPVLYMHDGQNVFDAYTAYAGEWEVDETLNQLYDDGYKVPIVVAIDNGGAERINEYLPWINNQYGGGIGDEYIDFLVETLKPTIDENYRTMPDRENTGLMGSSMGGIISQYGVLAHQDVYGKAGIFSPAYWISDTIWPATTEAGKQQNMKLYQLIGSLEGIEYIQGMWNMHDTLTSMGFSSDELFSKEVPNGNHNEALWRDNFREAYLWMFGEFANDVAEISNNIEIQVFPNPVINEIYIKEYKSGKHDSLEIIDMKGDKVIQASIGNIDKIDVSNLIPGSYLLIIKTNKNIFTGRFVKQ